MWVADMDFKAPDCISQAIINRAGHGIFGYSIRSDSFYEAIINWMKIQHSWEIHKEWIVFSPGVVPALNFIVLALTQPGDKIIVQSPVYFPFFGAVKDHGRILMDNHLITENNRMLMDFADLEEKMKEGARMLILCSPQNPGGRVWTREELQRLGKLCLDYGVLILSDEIHSDLVFAPNVHTPMASISEQLLEITVTVNAPSKTFNTAGLSSSYLIVKNEELRKKINQVMDSLHITMGNIFGTIALEAAYNHGKPWLEELLVYLKGNLDFTSDYFEKHIPQIKMMMPEATYLVWLDCRGMGMSDDELKTFFIEKAGVGLNPGIQFGAPGSGFMRLNIACPKSILEKALNQIRQALNS